ncbi:MAG: phosphoribosylamine--glycine ligase [Actinomycetota bacterium]
MAIKIMVVGGGGREHALVRALLRSPQRPTVICAPGNVGIAADVEVLSEISDGDVDAIVTAAGQHAIDLVVVGPEVPLVAGLCDALAEAGIAAFGPSRAAAQLEGSKAYAKEIMAAAGVPTAAHRMVETVAQGMEAIGAKYPVVIKADGLAAGKGVVIAEDQDQARAALEAMIVDRQFGDGPVLVEEFLVGEELSLLALCDGVRAVPMAPAQDYKRIYDGDLGPNTGGMGSYSPVVGIDDARCAEIVAAVHQPVVDLLAARGTPFHGVLYAGIMLTADGPSVLEFNTRFGDPETQAILPRLRSDLVEVLLAATQTGGLAEVELEFDDRWAVTVVLASRGYPVSSSSGDVISGLAEVASDVEVTHAGTAYVAGEFVTAGGRVLNVTALGVSPSAARDGAYAGAEMIKFNGRQLRRDIALRAVERA